MLNHHSNIFYQNFAHESWAYFLVTPMIVSSKFFRTRSVGGSEIRKLCACTKWIDPQRSNRELWEHNDIAALMLPWSDVMSKWRSGYRTAFREPMSNNSNVFYVYNICFFLFGWLSVERYHHTFEISRLLSNYITNSTYSRASVYRTEFMFIIDIYERVHVFFT